MVNFWNPPNRPRDDEYPTEGPVKTIERRFIVEGTENEPISHNTAQPILSGTVPRAQRRKYERERERRRRAAQNGRSGDTPAVRTTSMFATAAAADNAGNGQSTELDRILPGQHAFVDRQTAEGQWIFQRVPVAGTVIKVGDVKQLQLECPHLTQWCAHAWAAYWAEGRLAGDYGVQAQAEQRALQHILLQEVRTGRALDPPQPRMKHASETDIMVDDILNMQGQYPRLTQGQLHALAAVMAESRVCQSAVSTIDADLEDVLWLRDLMAPRAGNGE